jgi:hypothetical protein
MPWALATGRLHRGGLVLRPQPRSAQLRSLHRDARRAVRVRDNEQPDGRRRRRDDHERRLYLVRLVVSSGLRAAGTDPGYTWDMAVYANGQDAGGGLYFGPDLFPFGQVVQPVGSYAFYLHPRDNFGAPNGNSMLGRTEQHVATESILNLPDSVVTWPVTISARARHGLNDADVTRAPPYNLWLMRLGDSNPAAPTT